MDYKQLQIVTALRNQGVSPKTISAKTGIPYNTIKSYFRRHKDLVPSNTTCLECGKPLAITAKKKTKKFCSSLCRMKYWNNHQELINRKAYYHLTCKYCGKEFIVYGDKERKYCSRDCYRQSLKKVPR